MKDCSTFSWIRKVTSSQSREGTKVPSFDLNDRLFFTLSPSRQTIFHSRKDLLTQIEDESGEEKECVLEIKRKEERKEAKKEERVKVEETKIGFKKCNIVIRESVLFLSLSIPILSLSQFLSAKRERTSDRILSLSLTRSSFHSIIPDSKLTIKDE